MSNQVEINEQPRQATAANHVELPSGDYQVHFFLEDGRSLMAKKEGDTVDPIVNITVFGKKKFTKKLDDIGGTASLYWGEHFFWNAKNKDKEEIENERILIEVKDHRYIISDSLIGTYEMDLTYVYFQEKHALIHKWICLANSESKQFQSVRGYLKFGVSVIAVGDEQVDLTIPEIGETKDTDLLLPPQIQTEAAQLIVRCVKAEGLPVLDTVGTIDGYMQADFQGRVLQTASREADESTMTCYWYEDLYIPVTLPCVSGRLIIRVWDYDALKEDDIVGTVAFDWHDIQRGLYKEYFWANIYGAPLDVSGVHTDKMNAEPTHASYWRGRVLLNITQEIVKKPMTKAINVRSPQLTELTKGTFEQGEEWEIRAQVYSGVALPEGFNSFAVCVRWGDQELVTNNKFVEKRRCNYYEGLKRKIVYFPPLDQGDDVLPDIFVYLQYSADKVCFARLKPQDFMDPMAKPKWIQFQPDKAKGIVKNDWEGGFLRIRLYVGILDESNDTLSAWSGNPNTPPQNKKILMCNLYQCKSLPPSDGNALADPFVIFYCGGSEIQTDKTERMENLNPMWYRPMPLEIVCGDIEDAPPVIIYVYDYDKVGDNDLLGMCILTLDEASMNDPLPRKPKWYNLNMGKKGSELGEILVSFNMYTTTSIPHYNLVPEVIDTTVEINVLGLRDLKPCLGWVPINKAYVKFDLNSLQIPGEALAVRNVQTQPRDPGPNPNINTIIKINLKMPVDPLYCPSLTVAVYDYLFMGLSQPLIGTFTIELGQIFHNKKHVSNHKIMQISEKLMKSAKEEKVVKPRPQLAIPPAEEEKVEEPPPAQAPAGEVAKDTKPTETRPNTAEAEQPAAEEGNQNMFLKRLAQPQIEPKQPPPEQDPEAQDPESIPLLEEEIEPPKPGIAAGVQRADAEKMLGPLAIKHARRGGFIKIPTYRKNEKTGRMEEINVPDPNFYFPIGYDREPGDGRMHYRYYVKTELEWSDYIDKSPFNKYDVMRGQVRGLEDNPFLTANTTNITGQGSNLDIVGQFKGICRITRGDEEELKKQKVEALTQRRKLLRDKLAARQYKDAFTSYLASSSDEEPEDDSDEDFENMTQQLLIKNECIVRVYILDAFDLAQRDERSLSDPYVIVKLGKKTAGNPKKYQTDKTNCDFYEIYDIETVLPGPSLLKIEVWDHDDFFSDDLIGRTVIDLEDRFFSNKWQRLGEKPIETRTLWHKSTELEQGTIRCWVEIIPKKEMLRGHLKWDITCRPPAEFEARLIIWDTEDVANYDVEDTSDLYVRAWVNNSEPMETDTHYRCHTGRGSFNWRMKFPIMLPQDRYNVNIQIWDADLLSFNDFIADATFTYNALAEDAWITNRRVKRKGATDRSIFRRIVEDENDETKFWINCKRRNKQRQLEDGGKVQVSFELVPIEQARACPVGNGRKDPNVDPHLPPPVGRIEWSWNPFKMISQLCGPKFKAKICCLICCILCILILVFIGPMVLSNAASDAVFG